VEIRGPAVADLERAFAETWALCGDAIPPGELATRDSISAAGDVTLRVIASAPTSADLYRLDQLIAAGARRSLWLTDAYFVGLTPYVRALCAAAQDGVDVRLLVPGASDIWLMRALSRASYRSLLDSGIRVFEWNGPMLHAKTAVADGRWARVGSTNLNVASWIGNWELDVAVEDARFAEAMEAMYQEDLGHATEIVLTAQQRVRPIGMSARDGRHDSLEGSAGRVAAGALGIGRAVGAAVTDHRVLGPAEAKLMASAGAALLVVAALAAWWPWLVAVPLAAVGGWMAVALLLRAWRLKLRVPASGGGPTAVRASDPVGGDQRE
jgi:cardiolipin synthase